MSIKHLISFADKLRLTEEQHDALIAKLRQQRSPRNATKYCYRALRIGENSNRDRVYGAIELRLKL